MKLTLHEISAALGAEAPGADPAAAIDGVSTDSRTLEAGRLFLALQGDNFDGHEYCGEAVEKGAAALVVSEAEEAQKFAGQTPVFLVEDTLFALGELARAWRNKFSPKVVALSGSCGKTTTKDMIAHVARRRFSLLANDGNFNNLIGVPHTLFRLKAAHTHALLELGMNQAGELERLAEIVDAEGVALTNVNYVHCGNFPSLEALRDAKAQLIACSPRAEWVVLNADCESTEYVREKYVGGRLPVTTFGAAPPADFWCEEVAPLTPFGFRFRLCSAEGTAETELRTFGRANVKNAVCAAAMLAHWGLGVEDVAAELRTFAPGRWRSQWLEARGAAIIADCYNSSPVALEDALRSLADVAPKGRRVAVLGDMLELGARSAELHRRVGRLIAGLPLDLLVTVGDDARLFAEGFAGDCRHFSENKLAIDFLRAAVREGDVILIKGSRGLALEEIVFALQ